MERAVDDVMNTAMSLAWRIDHKEPHEELQKKFLRAARRLRRRSGRKPR